MYRTKPLDVPRDAIDKALRRKRRVYATVVSENQHLRFSRKGYTDRGQFIRYRKDTVVFKKVQLYRQDRPTSRSSGILVAVVPAGQLVHRSLKGLRRHRPRYKCRTLQFYVLGLLGPEGKIRKFRTLGVGGIIPWIEASRTYRYQLGWNRANGFTRRYRECAKGLHFFETLREIQNH